ncbi:MAG: hypothetical protein NC078_04530 [Ruminococcus sp.]|nr:hypothetical protein [Ruminococcus sp.]
MALAISRGDSSIRPEDVILWDNAKDANGNSEKNWIYGTGLKDWEQEKNLNGDGGQMYDGSPSGDDYMKNIRMYLSAGLPVIIAVKGHFVVAVGVESNIRLEDAELNDLVIFDPGTETEKKITTFGKSDYTKESNKIHVPYPIVRKGTSGQQIRIADPIDDRWEFVADENGNKTHDPYYTDPLIREDGSMIPANPGRTLKEMIREVKNSLMSDEEKEEMIDKLLNGFDEPVYENLEVLENGEYEPGKGVTAFDKVTVDVKAKVAPKRIIENGEFSASDVQLEGFSVVNVDVKANVKSKGISENGSYRAEDDGVEGYSVVNVNVTPEIKSKTVTENGVYKAEEDGADGFGTVTVNVPDRYDEGYAAGASDNTIPLTVTKNGSYSASEYGAHGFDSVNVNVPGEEEYNALKKRVEDTERYLSSEDKLVYKLFSEVDVTTDRGGTYTYRIRYDATDSLGDKIFERDRFSVIVTNTVTGKVITDWTTIFTSTSYEYNTTNLAACFYVEDSVLYYRFGGGSNYVGIINNWKRMTLNF